MLCKNCGTYADDDDIVCPECGQLLQAEPAHPADSIEGIRQGKRAREAKKNRSAAKTAEMENRKKRRSGASRATVSIPTIEDTRAERDDFYESYLKDGEDTEDGEGGRRPETFERSYRPVYSDSAAREEQEARYAAAHHPRSPLGRRSVNWVKVGMILALAAVVVVIGGVVFLKYTETGQKFMARMGQEASSTALWKVGEELMDSGDIMGAIADFEKARNQDALNEVVDVDGLLLLGNAYEAAGMVDEAAALYEQIYTETPSRTEAYVNHIRILLGSGKAGDKAKAGDLMALAYEKTGDITFYNQRRDLLPAPPEVDLTAGYYDSKKSIAITSYQGFEVYYTFDENAELPYGGTLFTERISLNEGIYSLRAVAKDGELVSDELRGIYKIIMPSPQTPRATLAPNTYKQRQRVRLKPGLDNENDTDIVIYYTIDGSSPDADSPIFTGDPIMLPGGRVTLKAVAVNRYNKVSNMLEILYKIEAKPYPLSAWTPDDGPKDFTLYMTTMTDFLQTYGEGELEENVTLSDLDTECRRYHYSWGYAVMSKVRTGWVLAEVYCTSPGVFTWPRGTKIGDTGDYVVSKFRDMGQVASASGNRGLYSNDSGTGKILDKKEDGKIIRYICNTEDSHRWQMDYLTNETGTVYAIDIRYLP